MDGALVAQVTGDSLVPGPDSAPVVIVAFLLGALVATGLLFFVIARLARFGYRRAGPVTRWFDQYLPIPFPTGMWGRAFVVVVGGLLLGAAVFVGLQGAVDVYRGGGPSLDGGGAEQVDELPMADAVLVDANASGNYTRPSPDTDGDRLADDWERAGETPGGAALPGADPEHRDLYVQVNYGDRTEPLTDEERAALKRVWAEMSVSNPDGEQGIRLHIDDESPRGGQMDVIGLVTEREGWTGQHYTRERLGDRQCVYHQVVLGRVATDEETTALAATPGYGAVVDASPREGFGGNASWRVYAITHVLLHNVLGPRPNELTHTDGGWLDTPLGPEDDRLSPVAADIIDERGFRGSAHYQNEVCG